MSRSSNRKRRNKSLVALVRAAARGSDQALNELIARAVGGSSRALDGLLALAWSGNHCAVDGLIVVCRRGTQQGEDDLPVLEELPDLETLEAQYPPLPEAHQRALDNLGDDFIDRLLESTRLHRPVPPLRIWPGPSSGAG